MKLRNVEDVYPLSEMQQGLLFHSLSEPESGAYIEQVDWEIKQGWDSRLHGEAWNRVVKRHPILRTAFFWKDLEEPLQAVRKTVDLPRRALDWRDRSESEQRRRWEELAAADRRRGFDPSRAPLMRLTEVRLGNRHWRLLWSYHHLLLDGWSVTLLLREVFQIYEALRSGVEPRLQSPPSFRDYIAWLRAHDLTTARQYWRSLLGDYRGPERLPLDRSATGGAHAWGRQRTAALRLRDLDRLKDFTRRRQVTLSSLAHAAWACLLYRCTGESDLVFGSVAAGRPTALEGFETMIGLFVNTLPFRFRITPRQSASELLKRVHKGQLSHRRFEFCSLKQIQRWCGHPAGQPLFESLVAFDNAPVDNALWESGPVRRQDVRRRESVTGYPLTLEASAGEDLELKLVYAADRFQDCEARRLLGHLAAIVDSLRRRPDLPVCQLPMLSQAERHQIVCEWNAGRALPVEETLHKRFENQAGRRLDSIALTCEGENLRYGELNRRANQLARVLIRRAGRSERRMQGRGEKLIGLCLPRSTDQIVAQLAALKAGSAYVPIDPAYPEERIDFLFNDSRLDCILTHGDLADRFPRFKGDLVFVDDRQTIAGQPGHDLDKPVDPQQIAYVIYTSGTTGRPKGVQISHACVIQLLRATEQFGFDDSDVWTFFHSESFDFSVWEIWGALLHGGRLVVVPYWRSRYPESFLQLLAEEGVTVLNQTPSAFRELMRADQESPAGLSLRWVIFGGETLDATRLRPWVTRHGLDRPRLVNMYGITETTVHATFHRITAQEVRGEAPTRVGRGLTGWSAHLLDEEDNPVPIGVPGEIHVGGLGLSRGYLNQAGLTAERFVPDPFGAEPGGRLYRSGDLGRRLGDGTIRCLGRIDDQIKIRGFRIEPGEVEWAVTQHPQVLQAAALKLERADGSARLAVFAVGKSPSPSPAQLREFLQGRLPEYMLPSRLEIVDSLPLTPHGKIDRPRLADRLPDEREVEQPFAPPQTELERELAQIWSELLSVQQIGRNDNFFELGGDSILSMQLAARARRLGLEATPRDVFEHPTIAGLAALQHSRPRQPAAPTPVEGPAPLTPIQRWFFQLQPANPNHFNQSVLLDAASEVDLQCLQRAVGHLPAHHDALRLRFRRAGNQWRQRCVGLSEAVGEPLLICVDLTELPPDLRTAAFNAAADRLQASLDIERGPLLRAAIFADGSEISKLLLTVHHLATDAVSWRILLEDLQSVYQSIRQGLPPALPPKTASYRDWAQLLERRAQSESATGDLPYWLATLEAKPTLPCDFRRGPNNYGSARSVAFQLDRDQTQVLLQEAGRAYRARADELLIAALLPAFSAWMGAKWLLLNVESHGRDSADDPLDLSRTVGWLTRLFPVALSADAEGPEAAVKQVKEQFREALAQSPSYGLLRFLNPRTAVRFENLGEPEVSFNYAGQYDSLFSQSGWLKGAAADWEGRPRADDTPRPHLLEIDAGVVSGRLRVVCAYSENFHRRSTIQRLADGMLTELRRIIRHCSEAGSRGATPSDFPFVKIDQAAVDRLQRQEGGLEDVFPLTPMQEGMLFHAVGSADYFEQICVSLRGPLDFEAFSEAWRRLVKRHQALRSRFVWEGLSDPVRAVGVEAELELREKDWSRRSDRRQDTDLQSFLHEDRRRGFQLSNQPPMRLTLIRTGSRSFVLVWSYHHLLIDGWSTALLLEEVLALYGALASGRPPNKTFDPPYSRYLRWVDNQDFEEAAAFWRSELEGFQPAVAPLLPSPRKAADVTRACGDETLDLEPSLTRKLAELCRRSQVTLNTLTVGAWTLALAVYTGSDDVTTGVTVSGRPADLAGSDRMVGLFINTLPLRARIEWGRRLEPWLNRLQKSLSEISGRAFCPLSEIQRWSGAPPETPLFETICVFENYPRNTGFKSAENLAVERIRQLERTDYPLMLVAAPDTRLCLKLLYDQSRFERVAIAKILRNLECLLTGMTRQPKARLRDLPFLTPAERHVLLYEWNDTEKNAETPLFPARFEAAVQKHPDRAAVVMGRRCWTYRQLSDQANQLARYLRKLGAGPEQRIPVCLDRSRRLVAARLGVLKAGAAYVPLDPQTPRKRLAYMIEACQTTAPPIVVTLQRHLDRLPANIRAVCLDRDQRAISRMDRTCPTTVIEPDQLAYMVYTSGSTGRPKAVEIEHAGFANLLDWHLEAYQVTPADRKSQFSGLAFDASVWELWPYLTAGAGVYFPETDVLGSWSELSAWLKSHRITLCFLPTPLAEIFLEEDWPEDIALRALLTGGEQLHSWPRKSLPFAFVNKYGPTEVSAVTTWAPLSPSTRRIEPPPIGRPIVNTRTYVLDRRLSPVPIGAAGELYIGGVGVARGYHASPALTAESFLPDPFRGVAGARMYRTGDRARLHWDGNLEFLGRSDRQIKIRGFRVELGEVEAVLTKHPGIREAAVTVVTEPSARQSPRLAAYVTARETPPDLHHLQEFCRERLPRHMWPQYVVPMKALPLTPNGKIDRRALPPIPREARPARPYQPPRDELEQTLASIWSEALELDKVGVDDNFFELGGDSVRSVRIVGRAASRGIRLTPQDLFSFQSVAELAEALKRERRAFAQFPAAPCQRQLARLLAARREAASQWVFLELTRPFSRSRLERAVGGLIREHEALRLRFRADPQLTQWVEPSTADKFEITEADLSALSPSEWTAEVNRIARDAGAGLAFQAPPFDAFWCRLDRGGSGLLLVAHALVMDAASWRVLIQGLGNRLLGREEDADTSRPLTEWLRMERPDRADAESPRTPVNPSQVCWIRFDGQLSRLLESQVCPAYRTTVEAALLAAVYQACVQIEGRRPLQAELHLDDRRRRGAAGFEATLGCLRRIALVRIDLPAGTSVNRTLQHVKELLVAPEDPRDGDAAPTELLLVESAAVEDLSSPPLRVLPRCGRPDFPLIGLGGQALTIQWKMTREGLAMGWSGAGGAERTQPLAAAVARSLDVLIEGAAKAEVRATAADFPDAGLDSAQMETLFRKLEKKSE